MRFNFLALTTALLTASAVHGAPQPELVPRTSPTDVTQTLGILTSAVGNINAIVTQINGLTAIILAPVAVQALGGLIGAVQLATLGLNLGGGALPIPSATDQASICAALGTFLDAFTSLITAFTLQQATLSADNLGALIEPTLETALTTVQGFVAGTVTTVPVCGAAYTLELATIQTAVTALITALG